MRKMTVHDIEWKLIKKVWTVEKDDVKITISRNIGGVSWTLYVGTIPMCSDSDVEFLMERGSEFI